MSEVPFKLIKISRENYDALITKRDNTLYIVIEKNQQPRFYFVDQLVSNLTPNDFETIKVLLDEFSSEKADKTYVDEQDALKADKTYVDNELALKADLEDGKVPASQLPGFVDDVFMLVNSTIYSPDIPFPTGLSNTKVHRVLYFKPFAPAPNGGRSEIWVKPKMHEEWEYERNADTNAIYVALDTNKTYRMGQSLSSPLVEISQSLALGETSGSAYRGDMGKVAYDHSQEQGNPHNSTADEISYDGTISGLSSTNVKTAIDELASNKAKEIEWQDLVALRDSASLIPGKQYRITDFVTTTTQSNTQSAGHAFDLIVVADSVDKLNEQAKAIQHDGDTYFDNAKLEAWQVWYSLDNNTTRFAWAKDERLTVYGDVYTYAGKRLVALTGYQSLVEVFFWSMPGMPRVGMGSLTKEIEVGVTVVHSLHSDYGVVNWYENDSTTTPTNYQAPGKGVIYRMIDEWNNDVPYDFKNIQFIRKITNGVLDLDNGIDTWVYTFTGFSYENNTLVDGTILKASEYFSDEGSNLYKNNIIGIYEVSSFQEDGFDNILETLSDNVFIGRYDETPYSEDGPSKLVLFSFNNELGRDCYGNTFGYNVRDNSFGNGVFNNTFGNNVCGNSFGNSFSNNSFGNGVNDNAFGDNVYDNTFGDSVYNNSFGNGFHSNSFGNSVFSNSFGNNVQSNSFGNDVSNNSFGNYFSGNTFGNNVSSNSFGNNFSGNTFGNSFENNSFGNNVQNNSFGNNVYNNTFGNNVRYNSFGSDVYNNTFGNSVGYNLFGNNFMYNTVKNSIQYVRTPDTEWPNYFRYVTLENGLAGASVANKLNLEGIQASVGYNAPIKVARGVGTEIVAVWQNGITLAGLRKATPTTATWETIISPLDGIETLLEGI